MTTRRKIGLGIIYMEAGSLEYCIGVVDSSKTREEQRFWANTLVDLDVYPNHTERMYKKVDILLKVFRESGEVYYGFTNLKD